MINLWYQNPYPEGMVRGPVKVITNTIRSFEDCDIQFSLNSEKYKYNFFLQWDSHHVPVYNSLKNKDKFLFGPQIWPFSSEFSLLDETSTIVTPSKWIFDKFHNKFNVSTDRMIVWPVPIYAPEISYNPSIDCLIYFKNRSHEDLFKVKQFLENNKITYTQIEYGNYTQDQFKNVLSLVKFCFILDNTESQGIAIQEMMSTNKPLFVWDQPIWDHQGENYIVPATSVPYWSDKCGKKFINFEDINSSFEEFVDNFDSYEPAEFVQENLSPQKTTKIIVDYFLK